MEHIQVNIVVYDLELNLIKRTEINEQYTGMLGAMLWYLSKYIHLAYRQFVKVLECHCDTPNKSHYFVDCGFLMGGAGIKRYFLVSVDDLDDCFSGFFI